MTADSLMLSDRYYGRMSLDGQLGQLASLISASASLILAIAGSDRQPKAPQRKRGENAQVCLLTALVIV
jgi:hypothetical protein